MNNSIPVGIVPTIVSPSPQINQAGPTSTNFTVSSIIESTITPVAQTSNDNTPSDSIATNKVNSIVGIIVALSIGFCVLFVGVVYICCKTRRKRRERRNDTVKTYGQFFTSPDNIRSDDDKTPLELPEPVTARTRPKRANQTNSTATSSTVSRYSAIISQLGPSLRGVIPENNRLTKSKRYGYF